MRFGLAWSKSHSFHTGQTPTLRYNRQLMQAIWHDRLPIADIVNAQVISLEDAPRGYSDFDKGAAVKFVLDPHRHDSQSSVTEYPSGDFAPATAAGKLAVPVSLGHACEP